MNEEKPANSKVAMAMLTAAIAMFLAGKYPSQMKFVAEKIASALTRQPSAAENEAAATVVEVLPVGNATEAPANTDLIPTGFTPPLEGSFLVPADSLENIAKELAAPFQPIIDPFK